MKTVDQGSVVTTAALPKFNQVPTITSPNGVVVAVPVEVTVDANNKAKTDIQKSSAELGKLALELSKQPGYEYLATLDKTNDINWVQVDLIQKNWDYTQEGLTPGAAALIAIAITIAAGPAGPAGSGLTASMVATNAAGIALQTQAVITLINNKGDISKTLKDMASSDTIRNMATAALTAGSGAKLGLGSAATDPFNQKLVNAVGSGMTDTFVNAAINGVSLEDALKNSLRNALVDVFAAQTFTGLVKPIDANDFADNLAHKLVAAGVGCISASAKKQSCDAGALGAAVGEMLGDYLVDDPNALTDAQRQEVINAAKLVAGSVALLTNVDVNTAANSAGIAVENNSVAKIVVAILKIGKNTFKIAAKNGKVNFKDIKDAFKKEGLDTYDNFVTLADGQLTVADAEALVSLITGLDIPLRQVKIDMIVKKRGVATNPYQYNELLDIISKKGYEAKTIEKTKIFVNSKGKPKFLVRSNTSHSGDVFKGFNDQASALAAAKSKSSKSFQRTGSYDINLNRVAD